MTAGWCSRTLRAGVFAAVCVLLAALGHVLMSGRHVPAWTLAAGGLAAGLLGWSLAGRERGLPLIVAAAVAAQTALHSAFSYAQSGTAPGTSAAAAGGAHGYPAPHAGHLGGMGGMGGEGAAPRMAHTGHLAHLGGTADMTPLGRLDQMDHMDHMGRLMHGGSSWGMLAAHVLAALLTGLWLAYGERAAFRIVRAVAGRLAAPLRLLLAGPGAVHVRPPVRAGRPRSDRAPNLLLLGHAITTRGPPAGAAVL